VSSYIFETLAKRGKAEGVDDSVRRRDARTWFRTAAQAVNKVSPSRMLNDKKNVVQQLDTDSIGKMYMFFYDPKLKKELPYYDTFPLIFMIGPAKGGFMGINLHYLPPFYRAKLMDAIYQTINNKRYDETTKLKINYSVLSNASKYRFFRPCIKHYLNAHVQSGFLNVEPKNWVSNVTPTTERFRKATKDTVWSDSENMF